MKSTLDHDGTDYLTGSPETAPVEYHEPIIDFQTVMDYERLFKPAEIARALITMPHECVLIRRPFRWTKDGEPLDDASCYMDLEDVCTQYGWQIVARYGDHFAIVAPSEP
jgi:hypothetical protein